MKKKLIKHAMNIAEGNFKYQYPNGGGGVYVTNNYVALELEEPIEKLEISEDKYIPKKIHEYMEWSVEPAFDYRLYELPTVEELRKGIRNLIGKKRTRVVWSDGNITLNARTLMKAMENLNATVAYVSNEPRHRPIFLMENDDLQSFNREIILPFHNRNDRKGFWIE